MHSSSRLVTAYGVEDLAIIETTDAVLVVPRSRSQHVREVVEALAADNRLEATFPAVEHRPWGSFEVLAKGDGYQVKRLIVHPSAKLSLQSHRHRAEEWVVVAGTAEVTLDDDVLTVRDGETVSVAIGAKHRLANPGSDPLIVIETQIGSYLGEDDIDRYDDAYGRS